MRRRRISGRRPAHAGLLLLALGLALGALAGPAVAQDTDLSQSAATERATLRVDYFHTGGLGDQIFALDRVVVEPLPWPGHPSGDVDPSGHGAYRFEVRDQSKAVAEPEIPHDLAADEDQDEGEPVLEI